MKKLASILLLAFFTIAVSAQSLIPIKYGIKVGTNISDIISTPNEGVTNIETTSQIGISGGFYMEIALNDKWYIKPDLMYVQKGASFNYDYKHKWDSILTNDVNNLDDYTTKNSLNLAYIVLNPTVSYKASDKLALNFGPSVSFLISENYTYNEEIVGENSPLNAVEPIPGTYISENLDVGLNLGFSYYITESFLVDAKVNTGFMKAGTVNKITSTKKHGNDKEEYIFDLKNKGVIFSIAYLF